ncbi:hypothetical protein [Arthrobacter sp. PAMC25284]|uniref:Uncharacterized protein n=1 Tax=Arthrobacter oryzae TaxID=409290 RepID=A0A3N0C2H9_9MICC|nr:hypothetical protein [Arthrobacter sp. PAMC25284]QYF89077.1 hypothetical protein KY499_13035 [Arthrobacter sp. PAMC25284]RNL56364.1 hypothetical protein D7003_08610 [Arthrobacter oryzae]
MRSDDPGRYTVIHHIGPGRPGDGRPAGTYGLRLGGGPEQVMVAVPAAGDPAIDTDMEMD